jgi:5-methylcytosine-specific restriction endonuclease McrA
MPTLSARKRLIKKLDTAYSQYVRLRDRHCVLCGSTEQLQAGHLFSRVAYSTRWDLRNIFTQCASCNYRHESDPYPFTEWYRRTYGESAYHDLHRDYVTPRKFKDWELEELLQLVKEKQQEL